MAAPTVDDVELFTRGRLTADDDRTETLLASALAAARKYCGWHVTPAVTETLMVDGSGGAVLLLPTLKLTALTAVSECGDAVDVDTVRWSSDGRLRKTCDRYWTQRYRGVTVTITHGFDDAPEWNAAVLSSLERTSTGAARLVAGPFQYTPETPTPGSMFSTAEKAVLDLYRLDPGTTPGTVVEGS